MNVWPALTALDAGETIATMGNIEPRDVESIEQDGPSSGARVRGDSTCPESARRPRGPSPSRRERARIARERKAKREHVNAVDVGARCCELRLDRGLSLAMMHERGAPTATQLSSIERGLSEPSIKTLGSIAEALRVPLFQLFVGDDDVSAIVRDLDLAGLRRVRFILTGE